MKIAVTYDDGQIFQHFGKTEKFQIFETDNNRILSSVIVDTDGQGHEALADFLADRGVDSVICGGIGGGARSALEQAGIYVFGGVGGSPEAAVLAMLNGTLTYSAGETCGHHDHEEGQCCGRVAGNDPHLDSGQEYECGGCEGCSTPLDEITAETLAGGEILRMLAEQFSQAPTVEAYSAVLRCLRDSVVCMAGTMRTPVNAETGTETFKPDLADNGRHKFLPVFSSRDLAEAAAQKDSVIREEPFLDTLAYAEADDEVAGLVLDAMSRPFIVEKDLFDAIRALPSILEE